MEKPKNKEKLCIYKVKNIKILYNSKFNGGGATFGQLYIPILKRLSIKANNCIEVFAGPSFIGFSLLAFGICKYLTVADINDKALDNVRETVKYNRLKNKVKIYKSDVLDGIPEDNKFDLVVGNPPHFPSKESWNKVSNENDDITILKAVDENWKLHKKFYNNIKKYLNENAKVILVENSQGSSPSDFIQLIKEGGLKYEGEIYPNDNDIAEALKIISKSGYFKFPTNIIRFLPTRIIKFAYKKFRPNLFKEFYFTIASNE